jgi:hypothetical protein
MGSLRLCPAASVAAGVLFSLGCAGLPASTDPGAAQIWVTSRSHNRSDVDIYLLCGERDARWLGAISPRGTAAFEIPAASSNCIRGLNFFLVVRNQWRGYWVGPIRPRTGGYVELVVEKYAGLSAARELGQRTPGW